MKHYYLLGLIVISAILSSCVGSQTLATYSVGYQSVRTTFKQPEKIPENAEILLAYVINEDGRLGVGVSNRTDEIMVIDQTKSFFIDSDGRSTSYYDPTIRQTSTTKLSSNTEGASVNLGAIGSALGIGGGLGTLLSGVNVGGSTTSGTSTTSTSYFADQPQISLGPKGTGAMSKEFSVSGLGISYLKGSYSITGLDKNNSNCKFSVCISYSVDGGNTFKKIVTDFYANSKVVVPVSNSKNVNDALRQLYSIKPDALNENMWLLHFSTNYSNGKNTKIAGCLYDYQ